MEINREEIFTLKLTGDEMYGLTHMAKVYLDTVSFSETTKKIAEEILKKVKWYEE